MKILAVLFLTAALACGCTSSVKIDVDGCPCVCPKCVNGCHCCHDCRDCCHCPACPKCPAPKDGCEGCPSCPK